MCDRWSWLSLIIHIHRQKSLFIMIRHHGSFTNTIFTADRWSIPDSDFKSPNLLCLWTCWRRALQSTLPNLWDTPLKFRMTRQHIQQYRFFKKHLAKLVSSFRFSAFSCLRKSPNEGHGWVGLPWSFEYATYLVVIPGVRNYFQLNLPTKRRQTSRETKLSSHS